LVHISEWPSLKCIFTFPIFRLVTYFEIVVCATIEAAIGTDPVFFFSAASELTFEDKTITNTTRQQLRILERRQG
jgi:hypothetical protein